MNFLGFNGGPSGGSSMNFHKIGVIHNFFENFVRGHFILNFGTNHKLLIFSGRIGLYVQKL